jgi:hypothetical protein
MKKIIERWQKGPSPHPLIQSKLEIYRFRKLLENARAIMTLVADGEEKLRGEYIFDRHYVLSLVDQVIERSGMLVFDAIVLAPEGGEALYGLYDQMKSFAVDHFIRIDQGNDHANIFPDPGKVFEEPEFKLLYHVIAWIIGPLQNKLPTMMDFIRKIFDHIIPVLRNSHCAESATSWIALNGIGASHRIEIIDLESEPLKEGKVFINDLGCRPLGLMFMGVGQDASGNTQHKTQTPKKWIALTGTNQLSLRGMDANNRIYLEATLSGYADSDFIFIYAENPFDLKTIIPPGFHSEKTQLGSLAWSYDVSGETLEKYLIDMGEVLL